MKIISSCLFFFLIFMGIKKLVTFVTEMKKRVCVIKIEIKSSRNGFITEEIKLKLTAICSSLIIR